MVKSFNSSVLDSKYGKYKRKAPQPEELQFFWFRFLERYTSTMPNSAN